MLVANSAIGLFYYLRVVAVMYMRLPEGDEIVARVSSVSLAGRAALAVLALSLIWLGVYPAPVIDMIRKAIAAVT
jgi:NADH-quinone oxidoreductase subunit N